MSTNADEILFLFTPIEVAITIRRIVAVAVSETIVVDKIRWYFISQQTSCTTTTANNKSMIETSDEPHPKSKLQAIYLYFLLLITVCDDSWGEFVHDVKVGDVSFVQVASCKHVPEVSLQVNVLEC